MLSILSDKGKDIFNAVKHFESDKNLSISQCAKIYHIHRETLANKLKELNIYVFRLKCKFRS